MVQCGNLFQPPAHSFETGELSMQFRGQWQVSGQASYSRVYVGHDRPGHTPENSFHSITYKGTVGWRAVSYIKSLGSLEAGLWPNSIPTTNHSCQSIPDFRDSILGNGTHNPQTHSQAANLQMWLLEPFCNQLEKREQTRASLVRQPAGSRPWPQTNTPKPGYVSTRHPIFFISGEGKETMELNESSAGPTT